MKNNCININIGYYDYRRISLWRDEYEKIEPFYERYGIYIVGKSNKTGVIRRHDNASEYIVPIEYDKIEVLFSGSHMLIAPKLGQYRIMKITKNTKTMSPFYDKIGPFYRNAFAPVYRDGVMGVIDSKGEDKTQAFLKGAELAYNICLYLGIKIAILKENSPSCGVNYIHDGNFNGALIKGMGVTTELLKRKGIKVLSEKEIDTLL